MSAAATGRVVVNVLASDIAQGKRRSSCGCPVARAFRRAYPNAIFDGITPDLALVSWSKTGRQHRYDLTDDAMCWIRDFDNGVTVQPGRIHLFDL